MYSSVNPVPTKYWLGRRNHMLNKAAEGKKAK